MDRTAVIISARLPSTRVPKKMIKPFAGTTLIDIVLDKLKQSTIIPTENIYASFYGQDLKEIAERHGINVFHRSRESAEDADEPKVIYEWWDKLPARFQQFILINPCLPLLSINTIEKFTQAFLSSESSSMFSTIEKKNYIFMEGVMINHYKHLPPPNNKIMNTLSVHPWQEAAHCLYAGQLEDIQYPEYLGSFEKTGSPQLFNIPEEEYHAIDYPWQFEQIEALYKNQRKSVCSFDIVPGRAVGGDAPTFIIAEAGCNNQGSISHAKKLCQAAKDSSADAIKFQKRTLEKGMTNNMRNETYNSKHSFGKTYGEHRNMLELSPDDWQHLSAYCEGIGLILFASVRDEDACDFMDDLQTPFFKIASADIQSLTLISHVNKKRKPLILSTGMADMTEVSLAVNICTEPLVIMQCATTYPCKDEDIDLSLINTYIDTFGHRAVIGYSGHDEGIELTLAAVGAGAKVIEKHFTLDKEVKGAYQSVSITPDELKHLVRVIRRIDAAKGNGVKLIRDSERSSIPKAQKVNRLHS